MSALLMRDHVLVCLFTTVDERAHTQAVIVCMCERAYESRQGVLSQFWLNGERHVALLSMSVQKAFYRWPLSEAKDSVCKVDIDVFEDLTTDNLDGQI